MDCFLSDVQLKRRRLLPGQKPSQKLSPFAPQKCAFRLEVPSISGEIVKVIFVHLQFLSIEHIDRKNAYSLSFELFC